MIVQLQEIRKRLPDDFAALLSDSLGEGHSFIERLREEWASGKNTLTSPENACWRQ